ncbi:MAG: RecX family transcriptional regulator [Bacteroidaceae bacterium]|nr:RecX family transcriptional regulator [Bacteroidaceae bacterium]
MCRQDAKKKLILWKIPEDERPSIIDTLIKYSFIDEERYAKAYVKDKTQYNRWGTRKIYMMLRRKGIDDDIIEAAIDEMEEEEDTSDILRTLLTEKNHSLRNEKDKYKRKQKLIRFAISRGFEFDDIIDIISEIVD